MKELIIVLVALGLTAVGRSQNLIRGSIQQGSAPNKLNVVFIPTFNSLPTSPAPGEYVTYVGLAIGIPMSEATTASLDLSKISIQAVGPFAGLSFTPITGTGYTKTLNVQSGGTNGPGNEQLKIFSWALQNFGTVTGMSWAAGTPFVGATITFNSSVVPPPTAKIKLLDLLNEGGGDDGNTLFAVSTNASGDVTDYGTYFLSLTGQPGSNNSTVGTYITGDRFVQTDLLISLPVSLISFSGYKNGGKNTLNWTVASEVNNRGFEVLRSTDGVNYSSIGFVNSQVGGFSNTEQHYTFDDNSPSGKKQYYQLNQKDIDGRSKLSNIVMITRDKPTTLDISGLYPNPARTNVKLMIEAPQAGKITVLVTDMNGKTVIQKVESVGLGSNTIPVDITKLATGRYLIKLLCQSSDCETASALFNKE
jgi:hypothetical protein